MFIYMFSDIFNIKPANCTHKMLVILWYLYRIWTFCAFCTYTFGGVVFIQLLFNIIYFWHTLILSQVVCVCRMSLSMREWQISCHRNQVKLAQQIFYQHEENWRCKTLKWPSVSGGRRPFGSCLNGPTMINLIINNQLENVKIINAHPKKIMTLANLYISILVHQ